MCDIVPLHQRDTLVIPLGGGAALHVTRFLESPRVALTVHGPGGRDWGGVILHADRARLLASWLQRDAHAAPERLPSRPRVTRRAAARSDHLALAPARSADRPDPG